MSFVEIISVISAIMGVISGIGTLISIHFEIKGKREITVKKFMLIVFAVSLVVFLVSFVISKKSSSSVSTTGGSDNSITESIDFSTSNTDSNSSDSKDDSSSSTIIELPVNDDTSNSTIREIYMEPIKDSSCQIKSLLDYFYNAPKATTSKYIDNVSSKEQINEYQFVPQFSGIHRFEFSDVPNGIDYRLRIFNPGREEISSGNDLDNGDGLTVSMTAGETYYVIVEQYRNIGSYSLNIGRKKGIIDIADYTKVSDIIQYTDQENDYLFKAHLDGVYRFEFSDVPNGTDLSLMVFNSGWEQIGSARDLDNNDGLTVSLSAGENYYIRVKQYRNIGSYSLNIGRKKGIADITGYTIVSDSIQYSDQENDYLFKASVDGVYRFEFSDVPNGTDLSLMVFNSGWEQIGSARDLDNNDGLTVSLTAGENYYIRVKQYRNIGPYTLNIGKKKVITDITGYNVVSDSIQYTNQENDYLFKAHEDGEYRFEFSNVPNGTNLELKVFNSGWEQMRSAYNLQNGDGLTVSIANGEIYYIRVIQCNEKGNYSLSVKGIIEDEYLS